MEVVVVTVNIKAGIVSINMHPCVYGLVVVYIIPTMIIHALLYTHICMGIRLNVAEIILVIYVCEQAQKMVSIEQMAVLMQGQVSTIPGSPEVEYSSL